MSRHERVFSSPPPPTNWTSPQRHVFYPQVDRSFYIVHDRCLVRIRKHRDRQCLAWFDPASAASSRKCFWRSSFRHLAINWFCRCSDTNSGSSISPLMTSRSGLQTSSSPSRLLVRSANSRRWLLKSLSGLLCAASAADDSVESMTSFESRDFRCSRSLSRTDSRCLAFSVWRWNHKTDSDLLRRS